MALIYLLIEESFRELAARQMIGLDCLARGFEVVIAQQWWFAENLKEIPAGIVLFKGNNRTQGQLMAAAKQSGHVVTSIEEEAFGITYGPELRTLFDPTAIASLDLLFVQGKFHKNFVVKEFGRKGFEIAIVGNPRTDVILSGGNSANLSRATEIRKQLGDFVLVNTNIASINPYDIDTYSYFRRCVDVGVMEPDRPDEWQRFQSLMDWEHSNLRATTEFVRSLSRQAPQLLIIVRPHPSENHAPWQRCFMSLGNVQVVADRDHLSWILASRVMVHTGCTTGLEGFLLKQPVIGLCPDEHPWHAGLISNVVSIVYESAKDAVDAAISFVKDPSNQYITDREALLEELSPSLDIDPERRASERIAESFEVLSRDCRIPDARWFDREVGLSKTKLSGRRFLKAFVGFDDFLSSLSIINHNLNGTRSPVDIQELAPAVFFMRQPS